MDPQKHYCIAVDLVIRTAFDLDRGVGMVFHPLCGRKLNTLSYRFTRRQFCTTLHYGGWSLDGETVYYDRISGGLSWKPGEPFPGHWLFHPRTGRPLKTNRKGANVMNKHNHVLPFDYSVYQLDRGHGMRYHPIEWYPLEKLPFDESTYLFPCFKGDPRNPQRVLPLSRIGDGEPHSAGDPYLAHWKYDPFTGEIL